MATTITTAAQLQNMKNDLTEDYELGDNINCSGIANFEPVGGWDGQAAFTGTFDGKGYTISNFTINRGSDSYIGLFGETDGATIQDVTLEVDITADSDTGGLAGWADDTDITDCSVSGTVTANDLAGVLVGLYYGSARTPTMSGCSSAGTLTSLVTGGCGGLIGWVGGTSAGAYAPNITECYSTAAVNDTGGAGATNLAGFIGYAHSCTIRRCYCSGDVSAAVNVAGFIALAGWGGGTPAVNIYNCYCLGNVVSTGPFTGSGFVNDIHANSTVENCYCIGTVSAHALATAGFVNANNGTVNDCFWDRQASGVTTSDAGTGKTTAQMKTQGTYTNWNFTTIWHIYSKINNGYPVLFSVPVAADGGEAWSGAVESPTVTTDAATSVAKTTVTLNGTLDTDGGEACSVRFQYGTTSSYGTNTSWQSGFGTGDTFSQAITGLTASTTYHFRAQATNSAGTVNDSDATFTTLAPTTPVVATNDATGVVQGLATLNGTLTDGGGVACNCGFEYGLTTAYGTTTATQSRTIGQTFSREIAQLMPNTVYHFRALATNSTATGYGDDKTFTTTQMPGYPVGVETDARPEVYKAYALSRWEL